MKKKEEFEREQWELLETKLDCMDLTESQKQDIREEILHKEAEIMRKRYLATSTFEFSYVNISLFFL